MTTSKNEQFNPCHKSIISAVRQDESVIVASCLTCGWEKEIPDYFDETGAITGWDEAEEWFDEHVKARNDALLAAPEIVMPSVSEVLGLPDLFEEREI